MFIIDKKHARTIIDKYIISILNEDFHLEFKTSVEGKNKVEYRFILRNERDKIISYFELREMPGNCGMCISTDAYVSIEYRKKGIGKALNLARVDIARRLKYSILICTIKEYNIPQKRILKNNGWKLDYTFVNPRTKNLIGVYHINL